MSKYSFSSFIRPWASRSTSPTSSRSQSAPPFFSFRRTSRCTLAPDPEMSVYCSSGALECDRGEEPLELRPHRLDAHRHPERGVQFASPLMCSSGAGPKAEPIKSSNVSGSAPRTSSNLRSQACRTHMPSGISPSPQAVAEAAATPRNSSPPA